MFPRKEVLDSDTISTLCFIYFFPTPLRSVYLDRRGDDQVTSLVISTLLFIMFLYRSPQHPCKIEDFICESR